MSARDKVIVVAMVGLVAVATVVALVAGDNTHPAAPAFGGTYTEAVVGIPQTLNPLFAVTNVDRDVSALVFSGLTRYDQRGSVVPDLAESFRFEADGKSWVFLIRPDARWHDGEPVLADDVVFTVAITQDRTYLGPYAGVFSGVRVDKLDGRTVRFSLPDVYAPFVEATTIPLLPAHLLKDVTVDELAHHPFNERPVGTGPFKVEASDEQRVALIRNDDFYRTAPERRRPYLERVVLRLYPDGNAALLALARGEVQGYGGVRPADADRARRLRSLAIYFFPSNDLTVLFLNLTPDHKLFRDRAVRQAVALAVDRARVLQVATDGHGTVADEPVPPSSWAFSREVRRYSHAPDEARALLDRAGWVDGDGDGVRDKGGVALRFSLLATADEPRAAVAQQIARNLGSIGMRVSVELVPFAELVDRRARERSYDAMLLTLGAGLDPDPYPFWHSSQAGELGHNFTGFATLTMDRALEAGRRTLDQAKRKELYAQVFAQLAEEVPALYLYFADYVYAMDRGVKGVRIGPLADASQRFWSVEEWYVKTAPVE